MSVLAAMVFLSTTMGLVVIGAAVLGRRPPRAPRRGRNYERIQRMKQSAAEDVAAVRGVPVIAGPPAPDRDQGAR
jgi:hypothetical protein